MRKKCILSVIFICLSAVFFNMGIYKLEKGKVYLNSISVKADGGEFDAGWLKSVMQGEGADFDNNMEDSASFAAWKEFKNERVSDSLYGRSENANVVALYGQSRCILHYVKNVDVCDSEGCIIGDGIAGELFGTNEAEGQEIEWRGKKWTVRDVVREPSELVVVQAAVDMEGYGFDRINIMYEGNGSDNKAVYDNKAVNDNEAVSDNSLGDAARLYDRKKTLENFINVNGVAAYALRFDYLSGFSWLGDIVPGEWADFDGWKNNFDEYKKAVKFADCAEKSDIEAVGIGCKKRGRLFIFGGIVMLAGSFFMVQAGGKTNIKELNVKKCRKKKSFWI